MGGRDIIEFTNITTKAIKINEKPSCYTKNNDTYPLCKGGEKALHDCKQCCLYEDMND